MNAILVFLHKFCSPTLEFCSEDFHSCTISYKIAASSFSEIKKENLEDLLNLFNLYPVDLYFEAKFPDTQNKRKHLIPNNLDDINDYIKDQIKYIVPEENFRIVLTIDKEKCRDANILPIISLDDFCKHLDNLTIQMSLEVWSEFNFDKKINCPVWSEIEPFHSKSIAFYNAQKPLNLNDITIDRQSIIKNNMKYCYFANASLYKFIPEDFDFTEFIAQSKKLKNYFSALMNTLLIIYLTDFTEIEGNYIEYKLKGYRLVNEKLAVDSKFYSVNQDLKDIYYWVYNQGNLSDKLGLAKNVMTLHMAEESILSITTGAIKSVESNYDIYLKDNVKQYVEIKNKISELLISQSDKASDIIKNMFSTLKTSLWSTVTFFATVFIVRIINSKEYHGLITLDIYLITLVFIACSLSYLYFLNDEVREDTKRLLKKYNQIKSRYKDILNEQDLDRIIDVKKVSAEEENFIESRRKSYTNLWCLLNLFFFIVISLLYFSLIVFVVFIIPFTVLIILYKVVMSNR